MKKSNESKLLFHGSIFSVESPMTHIGRQELDFGPGFYLTSDRQQAIDWAKTKSARISGSKAILNVYTFDYALVSSLSIYQILEFDAYNQEWLDFISQSRKGLKPWSAYDLIKGGIANDSVITTVDAYVDGLITAEQALGKLINERLRDHVCILKQEIIDKYLRFVGFLELSD